MIYKADPRSWPFSFVRIKDITNKGESYMLRIKFIVKEAPNYSKECWAPYCWVDDWDTLNEYARGVGL